MNLVKENYDAKTFWICPMCGKPFFENKIEETNDDGTQLYIEHNCESCGAMLTVVADVSHVCVWEFESKEVK